MDMLFNSERAASAWRSSQALVSARDGRVREWVRVLDKHRPSGSGGPQQGAGQGSGQNAGDVADRAANDAVLGAPTDAVVAEELQSFYQLVDAPTLGSKELGDIRDKVAVTEKTRAAQTAVVAQGHDNEQSDVPLSREGLCPVPCVAELQTAMLAGRVTAKGVLAFYGHRACTVGKSLGALADVPEVSDVLQAADAVDSRLEAFRGGPQAPRRQSSRQPAGEATEPRQAQMEPHHPSRGQVASLRTLWEARVQQAPIASAIPAHASTAMHHPSPPGEAVTQATAQATSCSSGRQGLQLRPLEGIPVSIKDEFLQAGVHATNGLLWRTGTAGRSTHDELYVQLLRDAGAIPFVRSNVPQCLMASETSNFTWGTCSHPSPDHRDRAPGGSSGGEGCLIASGCSPVGVGSDIAGSVRIPAAWCGLAGFRPCPQRMTLLGLAVSHSSGEDVAGLGLAQGAPGVLATCVEDCARVMRAWLSPSLAVLDPAVPSLPWDEKAYESGRPAAMAMASTGRFDQSSRTASAAGDGLDLPSVDQSQALFMPHGQHGGLGMPVAGHGLRGHGTGLPTGELLYRRRVMAVSTVSTDTVHEGVYSTEPLPGQLTDLSGVPAVHPTAHTSASAGQGTAERPRLRIGYFYSACGARDNAAAAATASAGQQCLSLDATRQGALLEPCTTAQRAVLEAVRALRAEGHELIPWHPDDAVPGPMPHAGEAFGHGFGYCPWPVALLLQAMAWLGGLVSFVLSTIGIRASPAPPTAASRPGVFPSPSVASTGPSLLRGVFLCYVSFLGRNDLAVLQEVLNGVEPLHPLYWLQAACAWLVPDTVARSLLVWLLASVGWYRTAEWLRCFKGRSAREVMYMHAWRDAARGAFLQAWKRDGLDALLMPTVALPALPLYWSGLLDVSCAWTFLANLFALPAGTVPVTTVRESECSYGPALGPQTKVDDATPHVSGSWLGARASLARQRGKRGVRSKTEAVQGSRLASKVGSLDPLLLASHYSLTGLPGLRLGWAGLAVRALVRWTAKLLPSWSRTLLPPAQPTSSSAGASRAEAYDGTLGAVSSAAGLPVGVQVLSLPWADEACLGVMRELEHSLQRHGHKR